MNAHNGRLGNIEEWQRHTQWMRPGVDTPVNNTTPTQLQAHTRSHSLSLNTHAPCIGRLRGISEELAAGAYSSLSAVSLSYRLLDGIPAFARL